MKKVFLPIIAFCMMLFSCGTDTKKSDVKIRASEPIKPTAEEIAHQHGCITVDEFAAMRFTYVIEKKLPCRMYVENFQVNDIIPKIKESSVYVWAECEEYEGDVEAVVYCQDGELRLYTTKEIAAFDIVVSGCNAIEIAEDLFRYGLVCGVKQSGNKTHLVGYSLTKGCLPQGDIVIGSLSADGIPSVCGAALSDLDATKVLSGMNPSDLTGIRSVKNCSDGDIRYRLPLGHNHTMMIDVNGKKTIK